MSIMDSLTSVQEQLEAENAALRQQLALAPQLGKPDVESVLEDLYAALERISVNAMHSSLGAVERINGAIEKLGGTTNAQP